MMWWRLFIDRPVMTTVLVSAVVIFGTFAVTDGITGAELEATSTGSADTGNTFRYDGTNNQYIFNLSTKGFSQGTWQIRIDLGDGTQRTVLISLKK